MKFYLDSVAQAFGFYSADIENQALADSGSLTAATDTVTIAKGASNQVAFAWLTESGQPNVASWPSGTYSAQTSVSSVGADLTYTDGATNDGTFGRFNSTGSTNVSMANSSAWSPSSGTGLISRSVSWTPGGSTASDRFGMAMTVSNGAQHQTQDITLSLGTTSSYIEGPWPTSVNTTLNVQDASLTQYAVTAVAPGPGPQVRSTNSAYHGLAVNHTVPLPPSISSGDLLLVTFSMDNGDNETASITTPATGWVEMFSRIGNDATTAQRTYVFGRYADGAEGSSITVTTTGTARQAASTAYSIYSHNVTSNSDISGEVGIEFTTAAGGDANPDPPSHTVLGWGTKDTLWVAVMGWDGGNNTLISYPTNYDNYGLTESGGAAAVATGVRWVTAASENPGTATITASDQWSTATIAIEPDSAGSVNTTLSVQDASLTQYSPTVSGDSAVTLNVQDASLTQYSVTQSSGTSVTLGVQDVSLTQFSTSQTGDSSYTANVQDASLTQFSPTVSTDASVTLGVQDVSLTQYAVSAGVSASITLNVQDASLTQYAASVSTDQSLTLEVQDVSLTQFAASPSGDANVTVPTLAGGGGTIGEDTFTEAGTGTANLSTHTAETGGAWVKRWTEPGVTRDIYIDKDNDRATMPTTTFVYGDALLRDVAYSLGSTTMGDGYIEAQMPQGDLGSSWLVARQPTDNLDTFYFVKTVGTTLYLFRNTNYSYVQITTNTSTSGDWVRFRVAGSSPTTLQVERRTTQGALGTGWHIDTTDNTAANQVSSGYIGIAGEYDDDIGDITGTVDNFLAVSESGGGTFGAVVEQHAVTVSTPTNSIVGPQDVSLTQYSVSVSTDQSLTLNVQDASVNVFSVSVAAGGSVSSEVGPQDVSLTQFSTSVTGDSAYTANVQDASLTQFPVSVTGDSSYQIFMVDAQVNVHSVSVSAGGNVESIVGPLDASITQYSVSVSAGNDVDSVVGPQNVSVTQYAVDVQNVNDFGLNVQNASLTQYSVSTSQGVGSEVGPQAASITPYTPTVTTEQLLTLEVQDATVDVYPVNVATPNDVVVGPVTATVTPYSVTVDTTSTVSEVIGPNNVQTSALPVQVTYGVGISANLQSLTIGQYPVVAGIGEESVLSVQDISLSSHNPSVTLGASVVLAKQSPHISLLPVSAIGEDPLAYSPPTLQTLRGNIQRDIRDPNAQVFDPEEVNDFINEAIAMLNTMSPFENKEAVASTNAVDGAFPTQLSYVWRVEVNATGFTEAPPIPPHNSEDRGPRRGWFFWNGIVQIGDWWWQWLSKFEAATLTFWGYEVRDPMTLDAQVAQFQSLDEEFTVRKYARVLAFRRLQNERSLFQQWQNLPKNTDISANQLSQMVMTAEQDYEKHARKHAVLRRPPEG